MKIKSKVMLWEELESLDYSNIVSFKKIDEICNETFVLTKELKVWLNDNFRNQDGTTRIIKMIEGLENDFKSN